jgi:hypothetical protein
LKSLLFVHLEKLPDGNGINIRTGTVKQQVGAERWLLEFNGANYRFSNVFNAEQLERFAFFNTDAERQQFLTELQESRSAHPGIEIAPPAPPAEPAGDPPSDG